MKHKILFTAFALFFMINLLEAQVLWSSRFGVSGQDSAIGIVVVGDNVIITGFRNVTGSNADIYTIKYNALTGDTLWSRSISGSANNLDQPTALVADANFVYITGWIFNPTRDVFVAKINIATGDSAWVRTINSPLNGGDYGYDVAVDNSGNVYVTGRIDAGSAQRIVTLKYNSAGDLQWQTSHIPPNPPITGSFDVGRSIKVDNNGNVYVGGYSRNSALSDSEDFIVIKYNSSGVQQWVSRYNGNINKIDFVIGIVLDNVPNVYIGGYSDRQGNTYDFVTLKYDGLTGDSMAAAIYSGTGGLDIMTAITNDVNGNVYVTGYSQGIGTNADFLTIKYNASLQQQWEARTTGTMGVNYPSDIIVNNTGNVYVTGSTKAGGVTGNFDYLTVRYDSMGTETSSLTFQGNANGNDFSTSIALDALSNVYVTGSAVFTAPSGTDMLTNRYNTTLSAIKKIDENIPSEFSLYQNYPNPFNPVTNIRFDISRQSKITVSVFDALGREIETLVNSNLLPGQYNVDFNAANYPSGIYFYKLVSNDYSETRKMVLIK